MIIKSTKHLVFSLVSVGLLCLSISGEAQVNTVKDARYTLALIFAKNQDYESSIKLLKQLVSEHPQNINYLSDYVEVLASAGKDETVLALLEKTPVNQVRAYVLEAIARSARNLRKFKQSESIYQTVISRFPDRIDAYIGLAFVLVDQNRSNEALKIILPLEKKYPTHPEILFTAGYIYEMGQPTDFFEALKYYEKVLVINSNHTSAIKRRILITSKLGAPSLADSMAKKYPEGFFSANEIARIKWDKAAYWIRWGQYGDTVNETKRFDDTDKAIKEIAQNIASVNAEKLDKNWETNARFDLIIALRDRVHMQEAIKECEKLLKEKIELSTGAMIALGDAYLYIGQPRLAKQWYFSALKESPKSYPLRLSIFYAHLDAEDHDDAFKTIEKLAGEQELKKVRVYPGINGAGPTVVTAENKNKTNAEATFSMASAYLDDLATAEKKAKFLSDSAPHNQYLRGNLATVYSLRGWPRRAQEDYVIGLKADPENIDLKIDSARNLLELREYRQAEKQVTDLYKLYPESKHAQKQYELWGIHNKRELHVEVNGSATSGAIGAQQQGSHDFGMDSHLYSSPIDYNFRVFLHNKWTKARFIEGFGIASREGVGVEYSRPDFTLTTEIHNTNYASSTNKIGFSVGGNYDFDDRWSVNSLFESVSTKTPLRALKNNVYAQSINLGGKLRQHESREISVNGGYLNFSDGNQRYMASSSYMERWHSGSVYKFATNVSLFYTQNSKQDGLYFSPKQNLVSAVTFDNDWLTYRNYDTSWNQNLALTVGQSWQASFGNNLIYSAQYQHRWRASNRLELVYGSNYGRRYYDGDKAFTWHHSLLLNWRF